jgi:hypothetical protein
VRLKVRQSDSEASDVELLAWGELCWATVWCVAWGGAMLGYSVVCGVGLCWAAVWRGVAWRGRGVAMRMNCAEMGVRA